MSAALIRKSGCSRHLMFTYLLHNNRALACAVLLAASKDLPALVSSLVAIWECGLLFTVTSPTKPVSCNKSLMRFSMFDDAEVCQPCLQ